MKTEQDKNILKHKTDTELLIWLSQCSLIDDIKFTRQAILEELKNRGLV